MGPIGGYMPKMSKTRAERCYDIMRWFGDTNE